MALPTYWDHDTPEEAKRVAREVSKAMVAMRKSSVAGKKREAAIRKIIRGEEDYPGHWGPLRRCQHFSDLPRSGGEFVWVCEDPHEWALRSAEHGWDGMYESHLYPRDCWCYGSVCRDLSIDRLRDAWALWAHVREFHADETDPDDEAADLADYLDEHVKQVVACRDIDPHDTKKSNAALERYWRSEVGR